MSQCGCDRFLVILLISFFLNLELAAKEARVHLLDWNYPVASVSLISIARADETSKERPSSYWTCSSASHVRSIAVWDRRAQNSSADYSCYTVYTKAGVDDVVGRGTWLDSCQKIADNIVRNLKNAGWRCRSLTGRAKVDSVVL